MSNLSLDGDIPPSGLSPALESLWWDGKGDWARAHDLVAEDESRDAAWVHAYLHRREGDCGNARYWYTRAGQPVSNAPLRAEWQAIVDALNAAT